VTIPSAGGRPDRATPAPAGPMYARPRPTRPAVTRGDLDAVQQRLYAIALRLGSLRVQAPDRDARVMLVRLETELGDVIREVRHLANHLPTGGPSGAEGDQQIDLTDAGPPQADLGRPPTVLIVDDHEVVRAGIRSAIERAPCRCRVVGEAGTVAEALDLVEREPPDVAILDVVLPDGDGIQLCRDLRARHPTTSCVLLTSFPDPRGKLSAALAGAAAYLPKDSDATDLIATIREVARGGGQLEPDRVAGLLEALTAAPEDDDPRVAQLTAQERRVFELVGQGLSNRQIAERLHLAEPTVKNYSSRMLSKLAMTRRSEAAVLSARLAERRAQVVARGLDRMP
jgi:two-component system, NarL family, response regulator DevR